ncbi:hypothetical protein CWE12_10300 [Aliidiomarina sedimenti]|uniref:YgjP-like metallopeptidase domain-containing protein n=1 Tax=Aliidiomarina sedimenti TaxID=1933879 RepID=A0ABY0BYM2_9GAMM|nr:hypothetical protein CWE12_10300 [Aliidiomarina sedimenti]
MFPVSLFCKFGWQRYTIFASQFGDLPLNYTLSRSKRRRTIGITIKQGKVKVAAPESVDLHRIDSFVASKQDWITRHLQAQQTRLRDLPKRLWQHGETLFWLGQTMRLEVRPGHRNTIEAIDNTLQIRLSRRCTQPAAQTQKLVQQWFRQEARQWLDSHIPDMPAASATPPAAWRIANYTAKWGACSAQKTLSFSWRLFAAPEWVVRYVVLHELCHLTHFNHSPAYWNLVEHYDADYREAEQWLKQHGHSLLNDDYFNFSPD